MIEIFKPVNLYCDIGKTTATIFILAGEELHDNTNGYVTILCEGCKRWSIDKIKKTETELIQEGDEPDIMVDNRVNKLEQLLVDKARFCDCKSKIVVCYCTPVGCK